MGKWDLGSWDLGFANLGLGTLEFYILGIGVWDVWMLEFGIWDPGFKDFVLCMLLFFAGFEQTIFVTFKNFHHLKCSLIFFNFLELFFIDFIYILEFSKMFTNFL